MPEGLRAVTDLPERLTVSDAELEFLEGFLSDLVADMLNRPA